MPAARSPTQRLLLLSIFFLVLPISATSPRIISSSVDFSPTWTPSQPSSSVAQMPPNQLITDFGEAELHPQWSCAKLPREIATCAEWMWAWAFTVVSVGWGIEDARKSQWTTKLVLFVLASVGFVVGAILGACTLGCMVGLSAFDIVTFVTKAILAPFAGCCVALYKVHTQRQKDLEKVEKDRKEEKPGNADAAGSPQGPKQAVSSGAVAWSARPATSTATSECGSGPTLRRVS